MLRSYEGDSRRPPSRWSVVTSHWLSGERVSSSGMQQRSWPFRNHPSKKILEKPKRVKSGTPSFHQRTESLPPSTPASSPGTDNTRNPTVEKGEGNCGSLSLVVDVKRKTPNNDMIQQSIRTGSAVSLTHQHIFTDASIRDGQVGAAYYIQDGGIGCEVPAFNRNHDLHG